MILKKNMRIDKKIIKQENTMIIQIQFIEVLYHHQERDNAQLEYIKNIAQSMDQ